jgi:hypothetical protein
LFLEGQVNLRQAERLPYNGKTPGSDLAVVGQALRLPNAVAKRWIAAQTANAITFERG